MAELSETTQKARRSVRPLTRLAPYVMRYPALVIGALVFLLVAAVTTLSLPMAIRRMIDHGFSAQDAGFINSYFSMLAGIAILLAIASACRYYFVITLGERVVSDIRRDVFDHVTHLSAAFYDANRSGEIVSRLTADTTQIKSTVGATASLALAQHHPVRRRRRDDVHHLAQAFGSGPCRHSPHRLSVGGLRSQGAQALSGGAGQPRRSHDLCR